MTIECWALLTLKFLKNREQVIKASFSLVVLQPVIDWHFFLIILGSAAALLIGIGRQVKEIDSLDVREDCFRNWILIEEPL